MTTDKKQKYNNASSNKKTQDKQRVSNYQIINKQLRKVSESYPCFVPGYN